MSQPVPPSHGTQPKPSMGLHRLYYFRSEGPLVSSLHYVMQDCAGQAYMSARIAAGSQRLTQFLKEQVLSMQ